MPATRSEKTDYKVGPEHQGQYACVSVAFSAPGQKHKAEHPAMRLRTSEQEERQKRIKIADPSPPKSTKEQLVNGRQAMRNNKHTSLHFRHRQGIL
jgi:hypothetical protein